MIGYLSDLASLGINTGEVTQIDIFREVLSGRPSPLIAVFENFLNCWDGLKRDFPTELSMLDLEKIPERSTLEDHGERKLIVFRDVKRR
jgi:hypothetical protein